MKKDLIKYSWNNLLHKKKRSFLTILSILIGITAIFTLVSFGLGIEQYIEKTAEEAGTDKLYLQARSMGAPGTDSNFFISEKEVNYVSKISGVDEITPLYMKPGEIKFHGQTKYNYLMGYDPEYHDFIAETFTVEIEKGRALKKGELNKLVLGYNYQIEDEIFKRVIKLGDKVEVNGKEFKVAGFFEQVGNPADDANIYISSEAMELLNPEIKEKYGYVVIRAAQGEEPKELAEKIEEKLRKYKDQKKGQEDFYVQTMEDLLETFGRIITILNGTLILIALVSLLVASVNIINTMYTSVLERTKEIGIMKAIGAKNKEILFIFIFESGFLGLLGGLMGIGFGYLISTFGGIIAANAGYPILAPVFPWYLIFGCLLFATAIGALSGIFPAKQASKLKPVDALRYE